MPLHAGFTRHRVARPDDSRPFQQMRYSGAMRAAALVGVTALGGTGCLFLDSINSPPQAQIETTEAGPYFRGGQIALRASKSDDPNGDLRDVDWQAYTCSDDRTSCDAPPFAELGDAQLNALFEFEVPFRRTDADGMPTGEPVRVVAVEAEVFDTRGASHRDRIFLDLTNRAPTLDLQAQGVITPGLPGFPLTTSVRVVASGGDEDMDELAYQWSYLAPGGSNPGAVEFVASEDDPQAYVLTADITGTWLVEVTASDPAGGSITQDIEIAVEPDHPPCIGLLDPPYVEGARYILDRDAPARRFAVLSARDDLDSHPPRQGQPFIREFLGSTEFRWQIASPDTGGQLTEIAGHHLADYLLDTAAFAPGDQLSVRVEALDRIDRDLICGDQAPTCALVEDCLQRVTWDVEVR